MPQSAAKNRELAAKPLSIALLEIGGESSFGEHQAEGARRFATSVTGRVAEHCSHWLPEERPAWLLHELDSLAIEGARAPRLIYLSGDLVRDAYPELNLVRRRLIAAFLLRKTAADHELHEMWADETRHRGPTPRPTR
jgi:hypothetical protein